MVSVSPRSIPLGNYRDGNIAIDLQDLALAIASFIEDCSIAGRVVDADISVIFDKAGEVPNDVTSLLRTGTRFFDAAYYLACPDKSKIVPKTLSGDQSIMSVADTKKRLLMMYTYIMLRGSYPLDEGTEINKDIPNFLAQQFGMNYSPSDLSKSLCSFDIRKVAIEWVKQIPIDNLEQAVRQRILLSIPGYRMLAPFKHYTPRSDVDEVTIKAYNWVKQIALSPPDWSIFPATRSGDMIQQLGSFNKALGNLITKAFTVDQIREMVTNRMIFAEPVYDNRFNNWKSWGSGPELNLSNPISKS
jgi:hypothetical protein